MPEDRFPRLTVDAVIKKDDSILLIKRLNPPFKGAWALPGGFVDYGEDVVDAVIREAAEETGFRVNVKRLVGVYSDPKRDPRFHTVSVVYECDVVGGELKAGDDAEEAGFFRCSELPEIAFDHARIISDAFKLNDTR
jgi:8-oxo-dGTP diphosphatase